MEFGGKDLSEWLADQQPSSFPSGYDYRAGYVALVNFLHNIHKEVTPTNICIDGGYLTDHGPDHIRKLISRITSLLSAGEGSITPYEAYVLLAAAQFHDVGNIYGRAKHEQRSKEVMSDAAAVLPPDTVEKRLIYDIAQAHGGEEKDKLSSLKREDHVSGQKVRPQLLAAILKFADEIAEDSERGARYSARKDLLPPESEIYHEFALALNSVVVDRQAREVRMRFDLQRAKALKTFFKKTGTGNKNVYLIDEIMARTLRTHFERIYCSRFMRAIIDITGIAVEVEVTDDAGYDVLKKISFRLEESGYPETAGKDIYSLCPELRTWDGNGELNGSTLASKLAVSHEQ